MQILKVYHYIFNYTATISYLENALNIRVLTYLPGGENLIYNAVTQ